MRKIFGIGLCLAIGLSALAKDTASDGVLDSLGELRDLFEEHQANWIGLALPGEATLFQDYGLVVPFRANKLPRDFRKRLVGEYTEDGIPIFRITCVEDWETRQIVLYDTVHETELWRMDADPFHDPYAFLRWTFDLSALDTLDGIDPMLLLWLDSAKIAADFTLVEEAFYADFVIAQEQQRRDEVAARLLVEPEIAEMPLPAVVVSIETLADGTVLVQLGEPSSDAPAYAAPAMMAMSMQSGSGMLDQDPADGLSDVWVREMAGGVIDPLDSDLDGDGMSFQAEHDLGLNPNVANPDFFKIIWSDIFNPLVLALELNDVQGVNYELDESYNLVAGNWLYIPLSLNGNTNPGPYIILIPDSAPETFWRIRSAGFQDSGDDLLNDFEEYLLGTSIHLAESDGDGLSDVYEFINHLNPASATGINGALGDIDNDGYSNLEEQLNGTDPASHQNNSNTGTVATIRYYYDDDDRLTDFFSGSEVAGRTILTATHNIAEEVSAK